VTEAVGELVITQPMPSMPVSFWNDPDGSKYRESYFARYPGVWRHGDWVREFADGTFEIEGRSDATLNRGGVRMGSSEIYSAVEPIPGIADCLVVGAELDEGEYYMPLFVSLEPGQPWTDALEAAIRDAIARKLSPRHVPDEIVVAPAIPRTLTGKRLEVPVKRMLQEPGFAARLDTSAISDAAALEWFAEFAASVADNRARPQLPTESPASGP
jgi:acetoacetyl-CoA synthetase